MAIYHYHAEWVSRAAGQTSLNSLAYVQKAKTKDERLEQTFDYSKQHDELKDVGTLLPEGARQKYKDRENDAEIWNDLERAEKKDGKIATRLDFALPRELTLEQQKQLIRAFGKVFTDEGRVFSFGLHDDENGNPHADVLISCRAWNPSKNEWGSKYHFVPKLDATGNMILNPNRGRDHDKYLGKKVLNGYDVDEKRPIFERVVNDALKRAGSKERVDCRTLKAQREEQYGLARKAEARGDLDAMLRHDLKAAALDRQPTVHEFAKRADGGRNAEIAEHNKIVRTRNTAHTKRIKKRVRDDYWRKRTQKTLHTRRQTAKKYGCRPTAREIGRAAANERKAIRQTSIFQSILAADGKEKYAVTIYPTADALMKAERKTADQLTDLVGRYWTKATSARAKTNAQASKVAKEAAKAVKKSAKHTHNSVYVMVQKSGHETVVMPIKATSQVLRALKNLQKRNPETIGVPLPCSFAERSPFAAAERVGEAIAKAAYCGKPQKVVPKHEQPVRAEGGSGNGSGGGAPRESGREEPPERSGTVPAGELGHVDDIWDVDLRFLSEPERDRIIAERERANSIAW